MGCDLKRKITLHPHFRFLQEVLPVIEMIIYQGELFGEFNKPIAGENKDKIIVSNVTRANLLVFEPYCLTIDVEKKRIVSNNQVLSKSLVRKSDIGYHP